MTPTRRRVAPVLRQPSEEENAERERLLAERFGTPSGRGSESKAQASKPGAGAPARDPEVSVITLPARRPGRERTVQVADIDERSERSTAQTEAPAIAPAAQVDVAQTSAESSAGSSAEAPAAEAPAEAAPGATPAVGMAPNLRAQVIDSSGRAVPDIEVAVINVATDRVVQDLKSGADGKLLAEALAPGRYRLQVNKKSVPLSVSSPIGMDKCRVGTEPAGYGSVCVEISSGPSPVLADIVLPLSSGIQGTILGKTGAPVEGVLVRAVSLVPGFADSRTLAKTNSEGFFFFGLVPGPYELQMLLPGEGRPEEMTRSMKVTAKPGSALLLDAVDFSKRQQDRQEDVLSSRQSKAQPRPEPRAQRQPKAKVAAAPKREGPVAKPVAKPVERLEPVKLPRAAEVVLPSRSAVPASATVQPQQVIAASSAARASLSVEPVLRAQVPARREEGKTPTHVELRGRVISKWGESVPALSVTVESLEGRILEATQTSDNGQYILEDVPIGSVIVRIASDLVINREGRYGTTLLKRPKPVRVQTFTGQKRVSLKDVVVDIRRIYRLTGRIKVQPEALAEFEASLGAINKGQPKLTKEQLRRTYLRGLRLTQKNQGTESGWKDPLKTMGQAIKIQYDGSFVWSCPLPAEDILLVLEPRSSRKAIGYGGPIGVPVTPAGVEPAELSIAYPPAPEKPAPKKGHEGDGQKENQKDGAGAAR